MGQLLLEGWGCSTGHVLVSRPEELLLKEVLSHVLAFFFTSKVYNLISVEPQNKIETLN